MSIHTMDDPTGGSLGAEQRSCATRTLNRDVFRRDELLHTRHVHYSGGIKLFDDLTCDRLTILLAEGFCEADDQQNNSPTIEAFLRFAQRWPATRLRGYAVSRRRPDYRVSIDGLDCDLTAIEPMLREQCREEFRLFCKGADERELDGDQLRAWWD